jgi:hypothetical protein
MGIPDYAKIKTHNNYPRGDVMSIKKFVLIMAILVALTGCQLGATPIGISANELAATMIAQTATAASPATSPATDAPMPILPTETPAPPALVPTITTTSEPTLTAAPLGLLTFKDDFAKEDQVAWECTKCAWQDGALVLGPYDPGTNLSNSLNYNICKACGAHIYYHFKVEANFIEGQVDRYFGVIAGIVEKESAIYLGISPWQFYTIRYYNFPTKDVKDLSSKQSWMVKASRGTNTFEVDAKPDNKGTVNYVFTLNGNRLYTLSGKPATPTMVGLGMSFHAVTVAYDNFEYEEVVP